MVIFIVYNIPCCCFNMDVRCFTALRATRRMAGAVVGAWVHHDEGSHQIIAFGSCG